MQWDIKFSDEEFCQCKKFADSSSETQRDHRSGGTFIRNVGQISADTLRGKLGEMAVKKFLEQPPLLVNGITLDFAIYPRGEWDESDFRIGTKSFSVKSSKNFAKYLLLETKDLLRGDTHDYYILVLVSVEQKSATIAGFASRHEVMAISDKTLDLKKGDFIPNTKVALDADNHARHRDNLHNAEDDWVGMIKNAC